jgi:ferrous iron transport protein B
MLLLLGIVLWITIIGANYPSQWLQSGFAVLGGYLRSILSGAPDWMESMLIDGIYTVLSWVVAVMLPPMAIFFPLFTLLEDCGFLPRAAFILDKGFEKAGACGKQGLTICMGLGCNAVGVTGCRIIHSERERLIAILTNSFVPCNGRFGTLIALITAFFAQGSGGSFLSAAILSLLILLGICLTLIVSKLLSVTVLRGTPSSFILELPPYRKPEIAKTLVRSLIDRTLKVLGRAVVTAAPAGLLLWVLVNLKVNDTSIITYVSDFLDAPAAFIGLDGEILTGFLMGFPANEIVLPVILMLYQSGSVITETAGNYELLEILSENGWSWVTALCTIIFMLFHYPCATTCLTIKKETGSLRWTLLAMLLPLACGIILCAIISCIFRAF